MEVLTYALKTQVNISLTFKVLLRALVKETKKEISTLKTSFFILFKL